MRRLLAVLISLLSLAALAPAGAQQTASALPAGEGRDIVAVACTQCHGVSAFTQLRQGPQGWRYQIYDMVLRGAQVRPEEMEKVVQYLSVNYGLGVNVPPALVATTLPAGEGRDLAESRCGLCHGLDRLTAVHRPASEWNQIVARMAFIGAPVAGDDAKKISDYLASTLGTK
jgi:mono/diheme cytochrome c family protein